jgi:hypothetical protein
MNKCFHCKKRVWPLQQTWGDDHLSCYKTYIDRILDEAVGEERVELIKELRSLRDALPHLNLKIYR